MWQPNQKAQSDFLKSRLYCVAALGGVGSGKTNVGGEYAFNRIVTNPETAGLIGANSYKQLSQSTFYEFERVLRSHGLVEGIHYVFNQRPPSSWGWNSRYKYHDGVYSFWNGAQAVTRSLDNYEDIEGSTFGWVWIDETKGTKYIAYTTVRERLRCPMSFALEIRITTTPDGYTWLYELLDTKSLVNPEDRGKYKYFQLDTELNKHNPPEYYQNLLGGYTAEMALQQLKGMFINVTKGRVYKTFTDSNVMACSYDPSSEILFTIDFNNEPGAAGCWHRYNLEGRGRTYYKFDEIFIESDSDTWTICREFKRRYGEHNSGVIAFPDASGGQRSPNAKHTNHQIVRNELGSMFNFKMRKRSRNPAVSARVETTKRMFCDAEGTMRAFLDPSCTFTIRDYRQVVWKPGTNEIEKVTSDEVKRMLTHLSDADGYMFEIEEGVAEKRVTGKKVNYGSHTAIR